MAKMHNLDDETLKSLLLKYIRDEWIDLLNLMGKGDVSQLSFGEICDLCKHISRGKAKTSKSLRDLVMSRINKYTIRTVSRSEIGNLLENFKTNILGSLSEQLGTLKIQKKKKNQKCCTIYCLSQI